MGLTNGQKRAIHAAARAAGVSDEERRLIQRSVGGFHSAADSTATREGFIAVMAHLEQRCGGILVGNTRGYWLAESRKDSRREVLIYKVRQAAMGLSLAEEELEAFISGGHMTNGQYEHLADCPEYWLRRILEGLKAIAKRRKRTAEATEERREAGLALDHTEDCSVSSDASAVEEPMEVPF